MLNVFGSAFRLARALLDRRDSAIEARMEALHRAELRLQRWQGKGWGWDPDEDSIAEARAVLPLLPPRDAVLFDVGGWKGHWSSAMLRMAGAQIQRIVIFEPSPGSIARLRALESPQVQLVDAAVSATTGSATLYSDAWGTGLESLHQRDLSSIGVAHDATTATPTISLDDFTAREGIDHVDFVKMDIEGHELEALRGAERLLRAGAIGGLSFEFGGCNIDSRTLFRDFWNLLSEHAYSISRIVPGGHLLPIRRYSVDLEMFLTCNYVATSKRHSH